MRVSHIIIRDSFTREPRAVAVCLSTPARRANFAALLSEYRRNGYTVRCIERGAMYTATAPRGYRVSIWYSMPNTYRIVPAVTVERSTDAPRN